MCEFCKKFDFSTARLNVRKDMAHIELALCNTRFTKEQQFKYCPACGANLNQNKTNYDRIRDMSIEELARFICSIYDYEYESPIYNKTESGKHISGDFIPDYNEDSIKQWLEAEVTE